MYSLYWKFVNINYKLHLLCSLVLRLALIIYGIYHDQVSEVKYTDIDYEVFTDASRHILNGSSPYNRHTYRYSPLIAILLVPNIILHNSFGKVLFSLGDILVAVLIRLIVNNSLNEYECYGKNIKSFEPKKNIKYRKKIRQSNQLDSTLAVKKSFSNNDIDIILNTSMLLWLYNPLTVAIGTRGNCDSLAALFVLLTLYTLQCKRFFFIAGLIHGISIHFRLYPIIYSLAYYMFLSKFAFYTTKDHTKNNFYPQSIKNLSYAKQLKNIENDNVQCSLKHEEEVVSYKALKERKTVFRKEYLLYLIPNFDQVKFMSGCLLSVSCLTCFFYTLYGYKFLYETYIYHFVRKDTRHNFSLYFYLQYLTAWVKNVGIWQKVLIVLPHMVLLVVFSIRYGLNKFSLNFSILTQTIVMVIYNSVLTSQYFVWIMAILPLCAWQIKMSRSMAVILLIIWFVAQIAWLLPAYLLEFQGQNTFLFIWIQSVSFFCANIAVLGRLIMYFMPLKEKST